MIVVDGISKDFIGAKRDRIRALDNISFTVNSGEILGLVGPNGAGKTTLLRILATIIQPTSGTAMIDGCDVRQNPLGVRRKIGYLTGAAGLYERLTPIENLEYFGRLHVMSDSLIKQRISYLVEHLDFGRYATRTCDKLSTGEKQRVAIARAMLHDPQVLYFDEPTSGLDVLAAQTVLTFLQRCRSEGRTILFSSHIMSEIEALSDRIVFIHKGMVTETGTVAALQQKYGNVSLQQLFLKCVNSGKEA